MTENSDRLITALREAYDRHAQERDQTEKEEWKVVERDRFLKRLQERGFKTLLEVGAGPGVDSLFFRQHGLAVTAMDLSPEHVRLCRMKGMDALVADFSHLPFGPASFDAVYALNCLLHAPSAELEGVLASIERVLRPGGLFYWGQYGGLDWEGVWPEDRYEPKRFFRFYTDEQIREIAERRFHVMYCGLVQHAGPEAELHFQSLLLKVL